MHGQGGKGAWGRLHGAINHDPFPSNLRKHERIGQPTRAQLANVIKIPVIFYAGMLATRVTEAVCSQQQLLESEKVSYISVSAMSKASMTRLEDIASRTHQPLVRGLLFPRAAALLSDRFSWPLSLDGQQDEVAGYSAALEVGGCCASDAVDFLGIE